MSFCVKESAQNKGGVESDAAETEIKAIVECMRKKVFKNMLGQMDAR